MVSCSHLGLRLRGVVLPNGLVIDEIEAEAPSVRVGFEPWTLGLPDGGRVAARISACSLASFLNRISPGGLTDCTASVREGRILIEGTKRVLIPIRAAVAARLAVHDGQKLMIELLSAEAMGADIKGMIQTQIASVNPVLDCASLPIKSRIESVSADADWIELRLLALDTLGV